MLGFDRIKADGGALVLGFALVLTLLYRHPAEGLEAATGDPASLFYFLVLPGIGLLTGIYAGLGGPFSTVPVFALGSYLGVFGVALTVGSLMAATPTWTTVGIGLVLLALAVVAFLTSVLRVVTFVPIGALGFPID